MHITVYNGRRGGVGGGGQQKGMSGNCTEMERDRQSCDKVWYWSTNILVHILNC